MKSKRLYESGGIKIEDWYDFLSYIWDHKYILLNGCTKHISIIKSMTFMTIDKLINTGVLERAYETEYYWEKKANEKKLQMQTM